MPRFTIEQYANVLAKPGYRPADSEPRTRNLVQELKDAPPSQGSTEGDVDHEPDQTEADGKLHPKYRIAVTLLVSDNRARDADGALTSLLDATIHAVRRLNPVGAGTGGKRKARAKG